MCDAYWSEDCENSCLNWHPIPPSGPGLVTDPEARHLVALGVFCLRRESRGSGLCKSGHRLTPIGFFAVEISGTHSKSTSLIINEIDKRLIEAKDRDRNTLRIITFSRLEESFNGSGLALQA